MNTTNSGTKISFTLLLVSICLTSAGCSTPEPVSAPTPTETPPPTASRFSQETIAAAYASIAASPKSSATTPMPIPSPMSASVNADTTKTSGQAALQLGIDLYKNSQFTLAISKLQQAINLSKGDATTQVVAFKYMAFSQCVNGKRIPCRQSFDEILRLDPSFGLSAAEIGHPSWGPIFRQAKAAR